MGRKQTYRLRPSSDPTPEEFPLATNDFLSPPMFLQYCLYFGAPETENENSANAIELLKRGLQETLAQARPLVGTIEQRQEDYSIVVRSTSTVAFTVHELDQDSQEDGSPGPTFDELNAANFASATFGDTGLLCLTEMEQIDMATSRARPEYNPPVLGVQANVLRGGLAITVHFHHWALDFSGFAAVVHLWAESTRALATGGPLPALDPACLDRSRLNARAVLGPENEETKPGPTTQPTSKPVHLPISLLLFHLPLAKAAQLKHLCTPSAPTTTRISTYDAFTALWWRLLTRHHLQTYEVPPAARAAPAPFFQVLDMRSRLVPPLPARFLGNALLLAEGQRQQRQLSVEEVAHTAPLGELAGYVRRMTQSADEGAFYDALARIKAGRRMRQGKGQRDRPLMALKTTDWRSGGVVGAEFAGLERVRAMRHLFGREVVASNVYMYPARKVDGARGDQGEGEGDADADRVLEFVLPVEKIAVERFLEDGEVRGWFEFKGVEWVG